MGNLEKTDNPAISDLLSSSLTGEGTTQLISIQVLRAIAALMILVSHLHPHFEQFGHDNNHFPDFAAGGAGVDLFFVISGFVMVISSGKFFAAPGGPTDFFLRRVARIVPLYWVVTACWLYYLLATGKLNLLACGVSLAKVVASFSFIPFVGPGGCWGPVLGVGWTLEFEMFFYLCFAFAVALPRRAAVVSITILFSGIVALCWMFIPGRLIAPWTLGDPIILEFVIGMILALVFLAGVKIPLWASALLIVAGMATWACIVPSSYAYRILICGIPAAAILAAVTLCRDAIALNPAIRILAIIGDASYALYLTHGVILDFPHHYLMVRIDPIGHPYVYGAILGALCISAAIAIHLLFERHVTRVLQRLIKRTRTNRIESATPVQEPA